MYFDNPQEFVELIIKDIELTERNYDKIFISQNQPIITPFTALSAEPLRLNNEEHQELLDLTKERTVKIKRE